MPKQGLSKVIRADRQKIQQNVRIPQPKTHYAQTETYHPTLPKNSKSLVLPFKKIQKPHHKLDRKELFDDKITFSKKIYLVYIYFAEKPKNLTNKTSFKTN